MSTGRKDLTQGREDAKPPSGHWTVTGWVKNATEEEYFLHNFPLQGSGVATPALPRTWGVTVNWQN